MKTLLNIAIILAVFAVSTNIAFADPPAGVPEGWQNVKAKARVKFLAELQGKGKPEVVDYLMEQYASQASLAEDVLYLHPAAVVRKGKAEADKWVAGLLLSKCKDDLSKCKTRYATWSAQILYFADKKAEGLEVLNTAGQRAKTIEDIFYLDEEGRRYKGDGVNSWLLGLLESKCMGELATCDLGSSNFVVTLYLRNNKPNEAKTVLIEAGRRARTVVDCMAIAPAAGMVLGDQCDDWIAEILLNQCSNDLQVCEKSSAAWAARILQEADKDKESAAVLAIIAGKVRSLKECREIENGIRQIHGGRSADVWLAGRLLTNCQEELGTCGVSDAAWAARILFCAGKKSEGMGILNEIESGKRTFSKTLSSNISELGSVAYAWLATGNQDKAQSWALQAYNAAMGTEEVREQASWGTMITVADLLEKTNLRRSHGMDYSNYAATVVSIVNRDKIDDPMWCDCHSSLITASMPLVTSESRDLVKTVLVDEEGRVRTTVAKILSWAYSYANDSKGWNKFLETQADTSATPDNKAYWLAARAYAEMAGKKLQNPLVGAKWMNEALATAQSLDARIYVVDKIAQNYGLAVKRKEGLAFLASVKNQFSDSSEAAAKFKDVETRFLATIGDSETFLAAKQARLAVRKSQRQKAALGAKLAAARKRGDQSKVLIYEQKIRGAK